MKKATRAEARGARPPAEFYREGMQLLRDNGVSFLVGGAYAFARYTGILRDTKDFDLFVKPADVDLALKILQRSGYRAEITHPHWLAKAFDGDNLIDIIYRAGNGLCEVDESWFARGPQQEVLGISTQICAVEEMIWMKAYIMERERYDGADIAHLLESCATKIDWAHLLDRFGPDWRVLLSHLVLFGFIYPSERRNVPRAVLEEMIERLRSEGTAASARVCRGTLLSRAQYLTDVRERGFRDARLDARCKVTLAELESWTADIPPAANG
jgi:hypothetical protein